MNPSAMHITVGVAPSDSTVTVRRDVQLIKAALVYADRARLCSLVSSLLLEVLSIADLEAEDVVPRLLRLLPILREQVPGLDTFHEALALFADLKQRKRRSPKELQAYLSGRAILRRGAKSLVEATEQIAEGAGASGVRRAMADGLLDVQAYDDDFDRAARQFVETLGEAIGDHATFPLFDAQSGKLARLAIQSGQISVTPGSRQRSKHVALAADLFSRLPLFEDASVDELIDIRRELERPRASFQAAMIEFARGIQAEPWDDDFPLEADAVFRSKVAAAILEIEEQTRVNRIFAPFMRRLASTPALTGALLGMGLAHAGSFPSLVKDALGIAIPVGVAAYDTFREWELATSKIRGNQLFFYYQMDQKLEARLAS